MSDFVTDFSEQIVVVVMSFVHIINKWSHDFSHAICNK